MQETIVSPQTPGFADIFPTLAREGIPISDYPKHITIIMDGNRRWRDERGLAEEMEGHVAGFETAVRLTRNARLLPVSFFTLWAFAADNWRRTPNEVSGLMTLMDYAVQTHVPELQEHNARFVHLGRKDRIPPQLATTLANAESATAGNTGQTISLAIDFGGEDQDHRIAQQTVLRTAEVVRRNPNVSNEIILLMADPDQLRRLRDGKGIIPPADLIIRTSESRTSDVGWLNGKSTVLHFIENTYFPDMKESHLEDGVMKYAATQHRLGK